MICPDVATDESTFYDLKALARSLGRNGKYRRFIGLVESSNAVRSVLGDLEVCQHRLITALQIHQRPLEGVREQDPAEASILSGLFVSALICYVRATHSKSDERIRVEFCKRLNVYDQAAHKELVRLRNEAVAHFGFGDTLRDGSWATDTLFLKEQDGNTTIYSTYERSNYKQNTAEDLARLVDVCIVLARETQSVRTRDLLGEIGHLTAGDAHFAERLRNYRSGDPGMRRGVFLSPAVPREQA